MAKRKQQRKNKTSAAFAGRQSARPRSPRLALVFISLGLAALTWLIFGRAVGYGFVNYDDNLYVFENPAVRNGLTLAGLRAAFTQPLVGNWHPLTSLSLMLDAQVFGVQPGGYHFVNVLLHTLAVLLLFFVARQMTGAVWRSAFVAALFAIHPLRVESVVWISERKDVLSGVFFFLTLGAYARYARGPASLGRYLLVLFVFTLGLLSKAMLVTVPLLLLLLDYWPLRRFALAAAAPNESGIAFRPAPVARLLLEKIPLVLLSAAIAIATIRAQQPALEAAANWPLAWRASNALVTIWIYLRQMIWPNDLAIFYPHPQGTIALWESGLAALGIVAVSAAALVARKSRPYFITGWFWYLLMLLPVLGIIQVGWQARADRYTYLPQIGLYLALSWGVAQFSRDLPARRPTLATAAAAVIAALMAIAWRQTGFWSSSVQLWRHALAVTRNNDVAERGLGTALLPLGRVDEAIAHEREALRIRPHDPNILTNLGNALLRKGALQEAIAHYRAALRFRPNDADIHRDLGRALAQAHAPEEALAEYRAALQLRPNDSSLCDNVGNLLLQKGALDDAAASLQKAIALNPRNASAHYNLALTFLQQKRLDEAIAQFRETLRLQPRNADAQNNLGIALLRKGATAEAIAAWRAALQIQPANADLHNNLGVAFLQQDRTADAIAQWKETLRLDPAKLSTQLTLAWLLATAPDAQLRNGPHAVELASRAAQGAAAQNPRAWRVLAAALAECGRFDEAMSAAQEGARRAEADGESSLAARLAGDIALYEQRVPLRAGSAEALRSL